MLKAIKQESSYEPVKPGSYVARLYSIIELGTMTSSNPNYRPSNKVKLGWELPTVMTEGENGPRPETVSRDFGLTMGKKGKLRPMIEGWFGRSFPSEDEAYDFDLTKLIGKTCIISISNDTDDDKVYANITGVSPLIAGTPVPEAINKPFVLTYGTWDQAKFDSLWDKLKEKMMTTPEYQELHAPKVVSAPAPVAPVQQTIAPSDQAVNSEDVEKALEESTPIAPVAKKAEVAEDDECPF
jgi:hypothetical protein